MYNVYREFLLLVRVPLISEVVSLSGRGEGLSPKSCLMDWKQCLVEEILWAKACDPLFLLATPIGATGSWVYCIVETNCKHSHQTYSRQKHQ